MLSLTAEALTLQGPWLPILGVFGILGFALIVMISVRGKIARRNSDRPSPRELIDQLKAAGTRSGGGATLGSVGQPTGGADLVETAQRLGAQLDNKARRLEKLIEEADQRIAALSGAAPGLSAPDRPRAPAAPSPARPPRDPLTQAVYEHADAGRTPVEIARELDEQVGKVELILALRE